ncbi:MAG: MATE family efflux transporter [Clostridia bacterium]|nr:MATE family efflux transporter [Clostridia bacterium]
MAKKLDLLDKSIPSWKLILLLAWPTIIEQILHTAVNYVDTAMVGSIGTYATAAIGVCTSTIMLLMGVMNIAGIGFSVTVARRIGEGDHEAARTTMRQAMLSVVFIGLSLTALVELILAPNLPRWMGADAEVLPYSVMYFRIIGLGYVFNTAMMVSGAILRCMGDTKTPLKFNILTNLINVCGNFLLIYPTRQLTVLGVTFTMPGAGWGVAGAAAATVTATTFSACCLASTLFLRKGPLQISLKDDYRPRKDILLQAFRLGVPSFFERATISLGQIVSTAMITGLGTSAIAAHQLANTGESLCYMPIFGFSIAATTLVAQNLGAGDKERARQQGSWCIGMAVCVMCCTSGLMFALAPQIIDIFSNDPQVIALGSQVLRIEALAEPFFAIASVVSGILRGAGDTKWPFYISLAGMWLLRVPVAFVLINGFGWSLHAVWVGMALDLILRGLISLWRFRKGGWMHVWELREAKLSRR